MVVVGTLSWNVNVEGASEAKAQANEAAGGMDNTATSARSAFDALGSLSAMYAGLTDYLARANKRQQEADTSAGFLASSFFFLEMAVMGLVGRISGLNSAILMVKKVFYALSGVLKSIAGLSILTYLKSLGAVLKGAVLWAIRGLITAGTTLIGWGKAFVAWLSAGSAGALAFAGAIGFMVGMLGVAALEVTGVLKWVRKLGMMLGTKLPGWARDGMLMLTSLFVGPLAVIGAAIVGFVQGFLRGGLSAGIDQAVKNAKQVLGIFSGAWTRQLGRVGNTIKGWKNSALRYIDDVVTGFKSLPQKIRNAMSSLPGLVTGMLKAGFNAAIPSSINIPSVTISAPSWAGGMSTQIGGGSLQLPQLEEGGMVESTGVAEVHEGETFIPADLRRTAKGESSTGQTSGGNKIVVEVGGIEIGDQTMNLSDLSRSELRELAEEIAEQLGTEVGTIA